MSGQSFIYRHINIYRWIMNVLYFGKYKKRFTPVIALLKDLPLQSQILELCFGDTVIADYCKKTGYKWTGMDINKQFVSEAQKHGHNAYLADISSLENLPIADVCIMVGSLYHFHPHTETILSKMFKAARSIIISEPVLNLSSSKGLIGFLAKRAASVGKRNEGFRYNRSSLLAMLEANSSILDYQIASLHHYGKDSIVKLIRNGKN